MKVIRFNRKHLTLGPVVPTQVGSSLTPGASPTNFMSRSMLGSNPQRVPIASGPIKPSRPMVARQKALQSISETHRRFRNSEENNQADANSISNLSRLREAEQSDSNGLGIPKSVSETVLNQTGGRIRASPEKKFLIKQQQSPGATRSTDHIFTGLPSQHHTLDKPGLTGSQVQNNSYFPSQKTTSGISQGYRVTKKVEEDSKMTPLKNDSESHGFLQKSGSFKQQPSQKASLANQERKSQTISSIQTPNNRYGVQNNQNNTPKTTKGLNSFSSGVNISSNENKPKQRFGIGSMGVKSKAGSAGKGISKTNQDSFIYLPEFTKNKTMALFGILDGHGTFGHLVSQFVKVSLPRNLEQALLRHQTTEYNAEQITKALSDSFMMTLDGLRHSGIDCFVSGTTSVVVLLYGDKMFCANAGDSRAILMKAKSKENSALVVSEMSEDHKPDLESEKKRIVRSGGRVEAYKGTH